MKKVILLSTLAAALSVSALAHAESSHSVSVGYAYGKIDDVKMNGVNVKYRYEWDSPFSVIGSFTYMNGKDEYSYLAANDIMNNKEDIKYYSLAVGPAYRINEYISLYGLLGFNHNKVDYTSSWNNYEAGTYRYMGETTDNASNTSFMYGVGVQINPMANLAIDIGYEGSKLDAAGESHGINGFNIGIGYRF